MNEKEREKQEVATRVADLHRRVGARIREIKVLAEEVHDYEGAHAREDLLYEDFVRWIAANGGTIEAVAMAKQILKTKKVEFPRHCG